jgi:hypothetical protein
MYLNGSDLSEGASLEADLCIVGAGPVGLSLASEFTNSKRSVLVIESGGQRLDADTQLLNFSHVDGDLHQGLQKSRHRQVGGTANLWNTPFLSGNGAKYVPLDRMDFAEHHGRTAWPLSLDDLVPYYQRAQVVAGLGPFAYESEEWQLPPSPIPSDHPLLASGIYQFGPASHFQNLLPEHIKNSEQLTMLSNATVLQFHWKNGRVRKLLALGPGGNRMSVEADQFILAAGGAENTRMLLIEADRGHFVDRSGWLGRGFMEHPRDYSIRIVSSSRDLFRRLEFFDTHACNGTVVCGRIALKEEAVVEHDLPNAAGILLPTGRAISPPHWRLERLARKRFDWSLHWPPGYGWSRLPSALRVFSGFQLLLNLEETPDSANRLVLESDCDRYGVPRMRLQRNWSAVDARRLERLRKLVVDCLDDLGLGPLQVAPSRAPDPNSHHHLGTTRMGRDEKSGVTDSYGQVFGTKNLFIAGGSLLPSGGYANPTLTNIALAIRLADRLASA